MLKIIPGNIVDLNTLIRSINVLDQLGNIKTNSTFSDSTIIPLRILMGFMEFTFNFLMRLPEKY